MIIPQNKVGTIIEESRIEGRFVSHLWFDPQNKFKKLREILPTVLLLIPVNYL